MPKNVPSPDLVTVIRRVGRELTTGFDLRETAAVAALATEIERDLMPRINPDRRYSISEIKRHFGGQRIQNGDAIRFCRL